MSVAFYQLVRVVGGAIFRVASAPLVLHAERAQYPGGCILAANHTSPYDAALLIYVTPRVIYWLSIAEIFRHPLARWFLTGIGASPLVRGGSDLRTMRGVLRHLRAGRVVGIFPEGGLRDGAASILQGGAIEDGVCKLAQLARVPVIPCVVLGSGKFARWTSWLPGARTRWAVAYGEPVFPDEDPDRAEVRVVMAEKITLAMRALQQEVVGHV